MRVTTDSGVVIECVQGDITRQTGVDAVVNAANAELAPGGGVAGAIHAAAGPGLYRESREMAPIQTGEAVVTGAHDLPNRYVIHVLGPVYPQSERPAEELAQAYRAALQRAEECEARAVAFPAISTGAFGYPVDEAAHVAFDTILAACPALHSVQYIRFVLFDLRATAIHQQALKALIR